MRFAVETWSPAYGAAADAEALEPSDASLEVEVEARRDDWAPVAAPDARTAAVLFVDGVQRIDARVWIQTGEGIARAGICASYAAGLVRCDGRAEVVAAEVERGLFTGPVPGTDGIRTPIGEYPVRAVAGETIEELRHGVQERMSHLEGRLAARAGGAELVVLDGPLRGRQSVPGAIGYVKTHHVSYLGDLQPVVGRLRPGERTPLFLMTTSWSRYSWYLRLPGGGDHPWAGIVRCEASADLPRPEAIALAERASALLPRFASSPHKEARAPQNLYPIGGLEKELRRRLGDARLLERALRVAAGAVAG